MYNIEYVMKMREIYKEDYDNTVSAQDGSYAIPRAAFFVGGRFHGLYMTHEELRRNGNGNFTPRWSAMKYHNKNLVNLALEDQPMIDGYLSPMLDGDKLRYETQERYDAMSD